MLHLKNCENIGQKISCLSLQGHYGSPWPSKQWVVAVESRLWLGQVKNRKNKGRQKLQEFQEADLR